MRKKTDTPRLSLTVYCPSADALSKPELEAVWYKSTDTAAKARRPSKQGNRPDRTVDCGERGAAALRVLPPGGGR